MSPERHAVPLVADAALVGCGALGLSAVAIGIAIASDQAWWLVLGLCGLGIVVSMFQFRYTELDQAELAAAQPLGTVRADSCWTLPVRNLPTILALTVLFVMSALFAREALSGMAGLMAGRGLMELRAARWLRLWEQQHGKALYGSIKRFRPIVQRMGFEQIYVRADGKPSDW